jgi:hypothetical protein
MPSGLAGGRHELRRLPYRYQKGAGHVARADRWLYTLDRFVLPSTPQAALQLLTAFMESHEQISENCWDDDFGASRSEHGTCFIAQRRRWRKSARRLQAQVNYL